MKKTITTREEDYTQWYQDIIDFADLAEHSDVRGSMIIKPNGYAIWEKIQRLLDVKIKETGHKNAYFPLFIPKSFISKEASHVAGFAKEMAVVTHHRLISDENGGLKVDPDSKLQEELIVRPTSETIINSSFSKWISSWRDLPVLINQWANVVRWELRPRLFLRTTEFLWQEGHTAHSTADEAEVESKKMLMVYKDFAENYLAIPTIAGRKSETEKFAGADITYTIEGMMQDCKALQFGTSHNLGQNFAKAFDIKYSDKNNNLSYVSQTSWGVSTRLIGGLIMTHSDDRGLVLPPNIAPVKIKVIPVIKENNGNEITNYIESLSSKLKSIDENFVIDNRDYVTVGVKFNDWEKQGVPIRIDVGTDELEKESVTIVRRDTGDKLSVLVSEITEKLESILSDIQKNLYDKASDFLKNNSYHISDYSEFKNILSSKGGFLYSYWCGKAECELKINEDTKATIRCIPFLQSEKTDKCIYCGDGASEEAVFAKAY